MYCNACGAQNEDTAATCFRCGAALQTATAQPQQPPQTSADSYPPPAPYQQPYQQPYQMASTPNIPDNLVMAILSLVICGCLPLGVMAIVNATQVKSKLAMGDVEGALKASENAKKFSIASWAAGILCCGAYMILNILAALAGN